MQVLLSLLLSLSFSATSGDVLLKIPRGIDLREQELQADLPRAVPTRAGYDRIEIVIYYFSQGIEKFTYSDNNTMKESLMKGEMKALVKMKKNNVLRKAFFIAASGANREQIIQNFCKAVAETLSAQ
ncbi:MAG: hypothetical protein KA369_14745 [Spirochaetes bacterium]|nr:hypothetical protein [Spirochaetota bacterium]